MKTISSREFNQDASGAKRAANEDLVFITDRGLPSHVLMSMDCYKRLNGSNESLLSVFERLGGEMDHIFEFEPQRVLTEPPRKINF